MTARLQKALVDYRTLAARYDHYTRRINGVRREAIRALALAPGETVVDVGRGANSSTGWTTCASGSAGRASAMSRPPACGRKPLAPDQDLSPALRYLAANARSAATANAAPTTWNAMNAGTFARPIPAKVSVNPRASVTAGLANEVEEVNQ